jgi:hypothetical protein
MEYYDLNSNQQKQQEEHNKRELSKIKASKFNTNEKIIETELYICNVLTKIIFKFYFDTFTNKVVVRELNIKADNFVEYLSSNYKEEKIMEKDKYNSIIIKRSVNYFCKYMNLTINHCQIENTRDYENHYDEVQRYYNKKEYSQSNMIYFLREVFIKEYFEEILLFIYENFKFKIIFLYTNGFNVSNKYESLLNKYKIEKLSEKRRMKSILENF